jgi:hypothetical protein
MAGIDGGNETSTYGPAGTFVTNKERAFVYPGHHIGYANFVNDEIEMLYWHTNKIDGMLFYAKTELEQCEIISRSIGTMRPVPKWVQ